MNKLNRFISLSEELQDLAGPDLKPAIAIIGSYNAGKSTLLNQLLGETISPVSTLPATNCLLYFDYGDSFAARYTGTGGQCVFTDRAALRAFLADRRFPGGRVNIELPAPLLKKCRLIDTPGIDAIPHDSIRLVEQAANESAKIIYLFHQRGMENFNRLFLYKLAFIWKNKKLSDISFWLNCNLGNCDGTSLETTGAILRKIFLSPVKLNAINLFDPENIQALRLFLEVELAGYYFDRLAGKLKKVDSEIPAKLKRITGIADESRFLSEFWTVWETTEKLFTAYRTIKTVPSIMKEAEGLLHKINAGNVGMADKKAGRQRFRPYAGSLQEGKKLILGLINALIQEKQLAGWLERSQLSQLAVKMEQERFTVVAAGGFSTGKSTFFNALMQEEILPTGNGPTTATITRVSYGKNKTATVRLPLQVTLPIHEKIGKQSILCAGKLDILEDCLNKQQFGLAYLEACLEGHFTRVAKQEMLTLIKQTRQYYATEAMKATTGDFSPPAVFKPVPVTRLARKKLLQKVRLTFQYAGEPVFDLTDPVKNKEFKKITEPGNAFRITGIDLRHPSEYLKLADFVDTPGLDAIEKHHFAALADYIRQCDAYLVFLNARHILNEMDKKNLEAVFLPHLPAGISSPKIREKEAGKIFFVINFADVLTPYQQEAVVNFVRKNLRLSAQNARGIPHPKIYLISALRGLAGKDRGMQMLLKDLAEGIMRYRGRACYLNILSELNSVLESTALKVTKELLNLRQTGQRTGGEKQKMRRALEIIRESRREIKNIRKAIYGLGRL